MQLADARESLDSPVRLRHLHASANRYDEFASTALNSENKRQSAGEWDSSRDWSARLSLWCQPNQKQGNFSTFAPHNLPSWLQMRAEDKDQLGLSLSSACAEERPRASKQTLDETPPFRPVCKTIGLQLRLETRPSRAPDSARLELINCHVSKAGQIQSLAREINSDYLLPREPVCSSTLGQSQADATGPKWSKAAQATQNRTIVFGISRLTTKVLTQAGASN